MTTRYDDDETNGNLLVCIAGAFACPPVAWYGIPFRLYMFRSLESLLRFSMLVCRFL